VPCNQVAFDLLVAAEAVFRKLQSVFLSYKGSVSEMVFEAMCAETKESVLPDCHGIRSKILKRFATIRLHIFAKGRCSSRKEKELKGSCHEMSSRSMQMRKSVSAIKKNRTS
jgi:hypothetical protein